ncbi:hydroxypyruvate isomerase family protein [Candidatus Laterigemmans baculatus]|uniref:hydroxypyruvate isomerase family protein n=1 Tax=Candidatus Laterigemmans baculatus TaxID=2770505 RepID=UPI0013DBA484|nr:TIM barrel protein [Candidatus Laterigemmans baculatus]
MALSRRALLRTASAGLATCAALSAAPSVGAQEAEQESSAAEGKFKLAYAPHPGMFRNLARREGKGEEAILDEIAFAAEAGFTAWEDNGLPKREPALQEKIGQALRDHDMQMGVFVAYANFNEPVFARPSLGRQEEVLTAIRESVDVARRVGARWVTVVPGSIDQPTPEEAADNRYGGPRLAEGYQTANVIELLRRASEILEPHDLVMVLEPLNWHTNHGGTFLRDSDQAYAICKAVDSPSCKILFDIYHQQITEGNLIPNIDHCWDEIAYFQAGDNPGRKEPGTGEINYRNVFAHIHRKGFRGVIGMEHGNSLSGPEGERAVIDAYREADAFPA